MAEILVFRARPRNEQESVKRGAETAQILFFTGVRYMRLEQEVDAPAEKKTKTVRRNGKQPLAQARQRRAIAAAEPKTNKPKTSGLKTSGLKTNEVKARKNSKRA
ncbi:MAG: hypothetical protein ACK5JM_10300 [Rhodoblastus sp.]